MAQSSVPCVVLSHNLGLNSSDAATDGDVSALQNFLKQYPALYPEGLVTGFFGPLTQLAVQRYQAQQGIVSSGDPETTGYGFVGPATRLKLATGCAAQSAIVPFSVSIDSAPQSLAPGTTGTWVLRASGGVGPYSFLANWDDGQNSDVQTNTTFTHTYSGSGTFRPLFAARDAYNRQASVGAPVVTVGTVSNNTPGAGGATVVDIGTPAPTTDPTDSSNSGRTTTFAQPTCTITASPTKTTKSGDPVTLSWTSTNTTSGAIPEIGPIAVNGSIVVNPVSTTTYAATFLGAGGSVACSASVGVPQPPPPALPVPNGMMCGARDFTCSAMGIGMKVAYGDEGGWGPPFSPVFMPGAGDPYFPVIQRSRDGITFQASPNSWGVNVPCEGKEIEVKKCGQHSNTNFAVPEDIVCPEGYTGFLLSSRVSSVEMPSTSLVNAGNEGYSLSGSGGSVGYMHLVSCFRGIPAPKPNKCGNLDHSTPECR